MSVKINIELPRHTEETHEGWIISPDFLADMVNRLQNRSFGQGLGMEEVEAVLLEIAGVPEKRDEGMSESDLRIFDGLRCSYSCPYYMDGCAMSYCRKFDEVPQYDGQTPPLRVQKCLETTKENEARNAH